MAPCLLCRGPFIVLGGEIAPWPSLDTTVYIGRADIFMDHFNKCLFSNDFLSLYEIGFGFTQWFLRCLKNVDDGSCLYCKTSDFFNSPEKYF